MSEVSDNAVNDSVATLSPTSQGTNGIVAGDRASTVQIADFGLFVNYIKQFVPVLLDMNSVSNVEFEKILADKSNVELLKKFLSDSQSKNLIFQKFYTKGNLASKYLFFCQMFIF